MYSVNLRKRGLVMSNRAAIYARFSSNNQREESIDAQVRAITEYANKHNYVIVKSYIDEAYSATTDQRPAFLEMINESGDDMFDIILIHKLDRFARNRYDSAIYKRMLQENDVRLISVLENIDDSPESVMLESTLEAVAEYFSRNLAREVRKGLKENALKGTHTGGKPPLGYMLDDNKKLIIHPDEAPLVKIIFEKYTLEGCGYSALADYFNNLGFKTKVGKMFTRNSFHDLLKNEKYIGTYTFDISSPKSANGKRNSHKHKPPEQIIKIENNHEAIISKDLFDKTQIKMNANKHSSNRTISKNTKSIENYVLTGIIYCTCGSKMSGRTSYSGRSKTKLVTYNCNNRIRKISDCKNKAINKAAIEALVLKNFVSTVFSKKQEELLVNQYKEFLKSNTKTDPNEILLKSLQRSLKTKDSKLNNLIEIMLESNSNTLIHKMESLENEIKNVKKEIKNVELSIVPVQTPSDWDIITAINIIKQRIRSGDLNNLNLILHHYISKIIVDDKNVYIEYAKSI